MNLLDSVARHYSICYCKRSEGH